MEKDVAKLQELTQIGVLSEEAKKRILKKLGEDMKEKVEAKKQLNEKKMNSIIHQIFKKNTTTIKITS